MEAEGYDPREAYEPDDPKLWSLIQEDAGMDKTDDPHPRETSFQYERAMRNAGLR